MLLILKEEEGYEERVSKTNVPRNSWPVIILRRVTLGCILFNFVNNICGWNIKVKLSLL